MDQEFYNYDDKMREIDKINFDIFGNDWSQKKSVWVGILKE